MIVGILLVIVAIINTIGAIKDKQKNVEVFLIINYWVFPVVYIVCYFCVVVFDISLFWYGMIVVIIEKSLYLVWRKK